MTTERKGSADGLMRIHQIGTGADDSSRAAASLGTSGLCIAEHALGDLAGSTSGWEDARLARYDGSCNVGTTYYRVEQLDPALHRLAHRHRLLHSL